MAVTVNYSLDDIILENSKAFVLCDDKFYYIYEIGFTHSTKKHTISKSYGMEYLTNRFTVLYGAVVDFNDNLGEIE